MTTTSETRPWSVICGLCDAEGTGRCLACPTRSRAFRTMVGFWHRRHRLLVAYLAVGLSIATAAQVAR